MTNEEMTSKLNDYWSKQGVFANARIEHDVVYQSGHKHHISNVVSNLYMRVPTIEDGRIRGRVFGSVKDIRLKREKGKTR